MTKVMCFGSFDVVHPGHIYYLSEAKKHGDELIVVIARDTTIKKLKKQKPHFDEKTRASHILSIPFVDKAILGDKKDYLAPIKKIKPDIIALGYDQKTVKTNNLKKHLIKLNINTKIIRIKAYQPDYFKSSKIKKK